MSNLMVPDLRKYTLKSAGTYANPVSAISCLVLKELSITWYTLVMSDEGDLIILAKEGNRWNAVEAVSPTNKFVICYLMKLYNGMNPRGA